MKKILHLLRGSFMLVAGPLTTLLFSIVAILASLFDKGGRVPHLVGRLWARAITREAGVTVTIKGFEHVEPGRAYVYAANHQSQFDIPAILGYLPVQFRWLAKKELFQIPVFGFAMRRAGYIPIDRSHPREAVKSLEAAAQKIRSGTSVVIFPEGTRSTDGRLLPFKTGGITLALRSQCPVLPVAIIGSRDILPRHKLLTKPGHIEIRIGPKIETTDVKPGQKDLLAAKLRASIEALMDG